MKTRYGANYFPEQRAPGTPRRNGTTTTATPGDDSSSRLDSCWKEIERVRAPDEPRDLKRPNDWIYQPDKEAIESGDIRRSRQAHFLKSAVPFGLAGGVLFLILVAPRLGTLASLLTALSVAIVFLIVMHRYAFSEVSEVRDRYAWKLQTAQRAFQEIEKRWTVEASRARFDQEKKRLELKRGDHELVHQQQRMETYKLVTEARLRFREDFMKRQLISSGIVRGLGASRVASLRSHGIRSAHDVSREKILAIPGFGEKVTEALVSWKKDLEARSQREPFPGLSNEQRKGVDNKYRPKLLRIEQELRQGKPDLEQIRADTLAAQRKLRPEFEQRARELSKARANWNAL